jgi:hypothetical protein
LKEEVNYIESDLIGHESFLKLADNMGSFLDSVHPEIGFFSLRNSE